MTHSLPIIFSGLFYNLIGLEKYSLKTYFFILCIIIGNIGVGKYWNY